MIRSTKVSLKFSNRGRRDDLKAFVKEYRRVVGLFIDILWEEKSVPSLLPKVFTERVKSSLSARAIQCAGKQASGIVRGTRRKHEQRVYMMGTLLKQGKDIVRLRAVLDKERLSKPKVSNLPVELDSRFVSLDLENRTSFDGWLTIGSLGLFGRRKVMFPFKRHVHFNKLADKGKMTGGVRLSETEATFMFEFPSVFKTRGKTLGVDVGITSCLATSDGALTKPDVHGHTLTSILKKVAARKKGSNGFREAVTHRKNYVNWSVNQLNLSNVREVRCEAIKNLRRGKRTSRFLSHWAYADMFDKLERFCEEQGVLVTKVNPAYTSQTCPSCRALGKRRGKNFVCSCGYRNDADLTAALNLAGEPIVPRENVFL